MSIENVSRPNKRKYSFYAYNLLFPIEFKKQAEKIKRILGNKINIEHIGSTSVRSLGGKGIIDIMVSVPKKSINKIVKVLEKNRYYYDKKFGNEERLYFRKFYNFNNKRRELHLHLTYNKSKSWKLGLKLRDYLRDSREIRKKYEKIKKEGARIARGYGTIYRKHKYPFLQNLAKKALKEI